MYQAKDKEGNVNERGLKGEILHGQEGVFGAVDRGIMTGSEARLILGLTKEEMVEIVDTNIDVSEEDEKLTLHETKNLIDEYYAGLGKILESREKGLLGQYTDDAARHMKADLDRLFALLTHYEKVKGPVEA